MLEYLAQLGQYRQIKSPGFLHFLDGNRQTSSGRNELIVRRFTIFGRSYKCDNREVYSLPTIHRKP